MSTFVTTAFLLVAAVLSQPSISAPIIDIARLGEGDQNEPPAKLGASMTLLNIPGNPNASPDVILAGGKTSSSSLSADVHRFVASTGTWTKMPDLPIPLSGHSLLEMDGNLVVFGGESIDGNVHNDVWMASSPNWFWIPVVGLTSNVGFDLSTASGGMFLYSIPPRAYHSAVIVPAFKGEVGRAAMIVYSGVGLNGEAIGDIWALVFRKVGSNIPVIGSWIRLVGPNYSINPLQQPQQPLARYAAITAMNALTNEMIVAGGRSSAVSSTTYADIWALNLTSFTWRSLYISGGSATDDYVPTFGGAGWVRTTATSSASANVKDATFAVLGGGVQSTTNWATSMVYSRPLPLFDLSTNTWTIAADYNGSNTLPDAIKSSVNNGVIDGGFQGVAFMASAYHARSDTAYVFGGFNYTGSLYAQSVLPTSNPLNGLPWTGLLGLEPPPSTSTNTVFQGLLQITVTPRSSAQNIDCVVSNWDEWTSCTANISARDDPLMQRDSGFCSDNKRTRQRYVVVHPEGVSGAPCPPLTEIQACGVRPCAADGGVRWAGLDIRSEVNDVSSISLIPGTVTNPPMTDAGAMLSVGSYQYTGNHDGSDSGAMVASPLGMYTSAYLPSTLFTVTAFPIAGPMGTTQEPMDPFAPQTSTHSYMSIRTLETGEPLGTVSSTGNGTASPTTSAIIAIPNTSPMDNGYTILTTIMNPLGMQMIAPMYMPPATHRFVIAGTFDGTLSTQVAIPASIDDGAGGTYNWTRVLASVSTMPTPYGDVSPTGASDAYLVSGNISYKSVVDQHTLLNGGVVRSIPEMGWVASISGPGLEVITKVQYTDDAAGVIVSGYFTGANATFDTISSITGNASSSFSCGTLINREVVYKSFNLFRGSDAFVARYNALTGACEWVSYFGGNGTHMITDLSVLGGFVFVTGTSASYHLEYAQQGVAGTFKSIPHAYGFNRTIGNANRVDGFVGVLNVRNGNITAAGFLLAQSDTSIVSPGVLHVGYTWNTTNASAPASGYSVSVGGSYMGGIGWSWQSSMRLSAGILATSTSSKLNRADGFLVNFDIKLNTSMITNSSVVWRTTMIANMSNAEVYALGSSPTVNGLRGVATPVGNLHALIKYDANTTSFNITGRAKTFRVFSLPSNTVSGGVMYAVIDKRDGTGIRVQTTGVYNSSQPGNGTIRTIRNTLLVTDRQAIYVGTLTAANDGIAFTRNSTQAAALTSGLMGPLEIIPSYADIMSGFGALGGQGTGMMGQFLNPTSSTSDVFAVAVASVEPFATLPCVMSSWSPWSQCARNCTDSPRLRNRFMVTSAVNGGQCSDPSTTEASYTCGTKPCFGNTPVWQYPILDTVAFNDDVGTIAALPDNSGVYVIPSFRRRNETASTTIVVNTTGVLSNRTFSNITGNGVFYAQPQILRANNGSVVWSVDLDNITAPDLGNVLLTPLIASTAAGGYVISVGNIDTSVTLKIPTRLGSPLNIPRGSAVATIVDAHTGNLIKTFTLSGTGTSGLVTVMNTTTNGTTTFNSVYDANAVVISSTIGTAVAYSSSANLVFIGGLFTGNVSARMYTNAYSNATFISDVFTFPNMTGSVAAVVAMKVNNAVSSSVSWSNPSAGSTDDIAWKFVPFAPSPSVASSISDITVSKDGGSIVYIVGSVVRSAAQPALMQLSGNGSTETNIVTTNITDVNTNMTVTITNTTTVVLPWSANITLPTAGREYVWVAAVDTNRGTLLWMQVAMDVNAATVSLTSPVGYSVGSTAIIPPSSLPVAGSSKLDPASMGIASSIALSDDGNLFVSTSYIASADSSFGYSLVPACNYGGASLSSTCAIVANLDALSGTPLGAFTLRPGSGDMSGAVRATSVSANAGTVVVAGTFSTSRLEMSTADMSILAGISIFNGSTSIMSDAFVLVLASENIGMNPIASTLGLWTAKTNFSVSQPKVALSPDARSIFFSASSHESTNNTMTRKAWTFSFAGYGLQCSSICKTCSSGSASSCLSCSAGFYLYQNTCVPLCPEKYYGNSTLGTCESCAPTCGTCVGPTQSDCVSCMEGAIPLPGTNATRTISFYNGQCVENCASLNSGLATCYATGKCIPQAIAESQSSQGEICPCHSSCFTCGGGVGANQCTSCPYPNLLQVNYTTGDRTCISPLQCYLSAGFGLVSNETGLLTCETFTCPAPEWVDTATLPIGEGLNSTGNMTMMPVLTTYTFNISAQACAAVPTSTATATASATSTTSATATPSVTPTATLSPGASPSTSPSTSMSVSPGANISATASPQLSSTASPQFTTAPSSSNIPAGFPVNCSLEENWGNWSSTCDAACARSRVSPVIVRTRKVITAGANGGLVCPDAMSPLRYEQYTCSCPSPSRTPLPAPVSTCFNSIFDRFTEADTDCGGDLGCPRCAGGRRCYKTLDCVGDATDTAKVFFARFNYTGPALLCSDPTNVSTTTDPRGVCTDARLSLSVYGENATATTQGVPQFVEFKFALKGVPASAPVATVVNFVQNGVWTALNTTNPALARVLPVDNIIVSGVNVRAVPSASPSPSSPPTAVSPSSTTSAVPSGATTLSPSSSSTVSSISNSNTTTDANATDASPSASSAASPSVSASASASASISSSASPTVSASASPSSGGSSLINCTYVNGTAVNCTQVADGSTTNTTTTNSTTGGRLLMMLRGNAPQYRSLADAAGTSGGANSDISFTIRILLPDEVNSTVAVTSLAISSAAIQSGIVTSVSKALLAANYSLGNASSSSSSSSSSASTDGISMLTGELLPASDPTGFGDSTTSSNSNSTNSSTTTTTTLNLFGLVQPYAPLVEKTGKAPGPVTPISPADGDSGGGGGGGAAGAVIVVLLLLFFGIAYYYVRTSGSFLGCTFGVLADCFGYWPLPPEAQQNRVALSQKGLWFGGGKNIITTNNNKKILSTGGGFDENSGVPKNPAATQFGRRAGSMSKLFDAPNALNAGMNNYNNNNNMITGNPAFGMMNNANTATANNNRQTFAPTGMTFGMMGGGGMNSSVISSTNDMNNFNNINNNNNYNNDMNISFNNGGMMMLQPPPAPSMPGRNNTTNTNQGFVPNPLHNMAQQQQQQHAVFMASFAGHEEEVDMAATMIQSVYRGHHTRRQHTKTTDKQMHKAMVASAGKASLVASAHGDAMGASKAKNVSKAAGSLAATETKAQAAAAISSMSSGLHTNKSKKVKKTMTELEAALALQRIYKGFKLRQALKGWVKVVDDDGDVFFKNEQTGVLEWSLPAMPFCPPREEGGGEEEEGVREDQETDEDGYVWNLDGPGGARLAWGWRRCEDGSDVWYVNDDEGESSWEAVYAD